MASALDYSVIPLVRSGGQEQADIYGLYVCNPPRRTARPRGEDMLVLYLSAAGNLPIAPAHADQLLVRLAQAYYQTPGSVTSAMRTLAENLNKYLLERNLKAASSGRQAIGMLMQIVLKNDVLYLGQSGPVHAYLIKSDHAEHIYDPQISGRGLGLSRTTTVRYFHATLEGNDSLLFTANPDPSWSEAMLGSLYAQGAESLKRKLLAQPGSDLQAVLLRAKPGKGRIQRMETRQVSRSAVAPAAAAGAVTAGAVAAEAPEIIPAAGSLPTTEELKLASQPETGLAELPLEPVLIEKVAEPPIEEPATPTIAEQAPPIQETTGESPVLAATAAAAAAAAVGQAGAEAAGEAGEQVGGEEALMGQEATSEAVPEATAAETAMPAAAAQVEPTTPPKQEKKQPVKRRALFAPLTAGLATLTRPVNAGLKSAGGGVKKAAVRVLPDESIFHIPPAVMALIAIAIPILVVIAASFVYAQLGRSVEFQRLYNQAVEQARFSDAQTDPQVRRSGFEQTLTILNQAEIFGQTNETNTLRELVQQALDDMDSVRRLTYKPAIIGGLPGGVSVSRMLVVDNDLYMLDKNSGNVLRGLVTSNGYELDGNFACGPDAAKPSPLGKLVDITASPSAESGSVILGMDANGGVITCYVGRPPQVNKLTLPARMAQEPLTAITQDNGDTYVLDPQNQAVWIYWSSKFDEEPQFYFVEQVPNMKDVIDLAVQKDELYLLHNDGKMTVCTYSALDVAPTRCVDPSPYMDTRKNPNGEPFSWPDTFTQVNTSPQPDPSLLMFDPQKQAVIQFSLRNLIFQRQFQPVDPVGGGTASAYAINPLERILFLADNDKVYYGFMP